MRKEYPEDYKGPKAGKSSREEWAEVRDYDAFWFTANGTWTYSDFDCYLYSMCEMFYLRGKKAGEEEAITALKEFQKKFKII